MYCWSVLVAESSDDNSGWLFLFFLWSSLHFPLHVFTSDQLRDHFFLQVNSFWQTKHSLASWWNTFTGEAGQLDITVTTDQPSICPCRRLCRSQVVCWSSRLSSLGWSDLREEMLKVCPVFHKRDNQGSMSSLLKLNHNINIVQINPQVKLS